jgi:hypothetical protein
MLRVEAYANPYRGRADSAATSISMPGGPPSGSSACRTIDIDWLGAAPIHIQ